MIVGNRYLVKEFNYGHGNILELECIEVSENFIKVKDLIRNNIQWIHKNRFIGATDYSNTGYYILETLKPLTS